MNEIICGELTYKRKKYHFTFQDNVLTMLPTKLESYFLNLFCSDEDKVLSTNIHGITEKNYYICFIDVKPRPIGSGALRCFVPAYVLNKSNGLVPVPKADKIEKIIFKGPAIDNFYHPKKIVTSKTKDRNVTIDVNLDKFKAEKYELKDETINIYSGYVMPYSKSINEVLNVSSYFEICFNKPKSVNSILKTYLKVQKLFGFFNNRRIINWDSITLRKTVLVEDEEKPLTVDLFLYVAQDPKKNVDIQSYRNSITFEDVKDYLPELYKNITRKDYNVYYMPLNKNENSVVDNDKFLKIAYTFESQMRISYPNFKSSINENFKYSKNFILKNINNELSRLSTIDGTGKKKKYLNQFKELIGKSDGNLEEKILYCFKRFDTVLLAKKNSMQSDYGIKKLTYEVLSKSFIKRRNKIAHGEFTGGFEDIDMISYTLVKMSVYCLILENCSVPIEQIKNICNKLF